MLFGIYWVEWLGYAASTVVAVSLLMRSLVKLRWINTAGSLLFAVYGFVIGAYPVGVFNAVIILINLYFLYRLYSRKESIELMDLSKDDVYLERFIRHYEKDIRHFFPQYVFDASTPHIGFYILRDMVATGIFMGHLSGDGILSVDIDYAVAAYRDLKAGKFVFEKSKPLFISRGIRELHATASNAQHARYLRQMGFTATESGYRLTLDS